MKSIILFTIIVLTVLVMLIFGIVFLTDELPAMRTINKIQGKDISYRRVESTGTYGSAQYYVFDKDGVRYRITRSYFDSLKDVPRK